MKKWLKNNLNLRVNKLFMPILVFLAVILIYSNSFSNKFTSEDYYLIKGNYDISNFYNLKHWPNIRGAEKPVVLAALMLQHKLFGENTFGYNAVNIAVHGLNSILVLFFIFLVTGDNKKAIFSALIFSLHPIQATVVNVPGFQGDLFGVLFLLFSVISFIKMTEKNSPGYIIPVFIFYILSIMSKAVFAILPLFLLFYIFITKSKQKLLPVISVLSLIFLNIFIFRYFWSAQYTYSPFKVLYPAIVSGVNPLSSFATYINTITGSFMHYIKTIFFPVSVLSYEYQLFINNNLSYINLLIFFLVWLSIIYTFIKAKDVNTKIFLAFSIIIWIPVSNIFPLHNIVADRYMYAPLIGLSFIICTGLAQLYGIFRKPAAKLILPVVLILLAGTTFSRNYIFRDMFSLYSDTVKKAPYNPRARFNLAVAYKENRQWKKSLNQLKILEKIAPSYKVDIVCQMKGENYQKIGDDKKAKSQYIKVLSIKPKEKTLSNLAKIYYDQGNLEDFYEITKLQGELFFRNSEVISRLGLYYMHKNYYEKARKLFTEALELDKKNQTAKYWLQYLQQD